MNESYQNWINKHYPTFESAYGDCQRAVQMMNEQFPELEMKAGWINGAEHWWCIDKDKNIIDPTIAQYGGRTLVYREFKPGDTVRVGKCMNCGWDIYKEVQTLDGNRVSICSKECEEAYTLYIEGEIKRW